jgi:predicted dehydrogenase
VQVVGLSDQDASAATACAAEADCPAYSDHRRLLVETRPDAVFLALPPAPAAELVRLAVQRGVHVWRETPLGRTLGEAVELYRAAESAGVHLAVGTQRRFMNSYRQGKARVARLGKLAMVQAHYCYDAGQVSSWHGDRASGGGTLLGAGYQMLDLLIWMLGLPESVYTLCNRCPGRQAGPIYDTEDSACCLLRYHGKAPASLSVSRQFNPCSEGISVYGQEGSLEMQADRCVLRDRGGAVVESFVDEAVPSSVFDAQVRAFAQAVRGGAGRCECSARENLLTCSAIEAAYLSDRTGQPESPAEMLAHFELRAD